MKDHPLYEEYLANNVIAPFYNARLTKLNDLRLTTILKRKNPYLFKAKNIHTAEELIRGILDAHLSSQEETIFGNLLEGFAIFVSSDLYNGFKRSMGNELPSVDLEFKRDGKYYIVGIKSGTAWGNSDQINRMRDNFKSARLELQQSGVSIPIEAVNGCIYGRDSRPLKSHSDSYKSYYKYAGQDFWEFISSEPLFYQDIIKPIDEEAKIKDERFKKAYYAKINEMSAAFMGSFLKNNEIDWEKLVDFISKRRSADSAPSVAT